MNPWTVQATSEAEEELADIWLQATDRNAVAAAQFTIEHRLARDPIDEGAEVAEGLWKIVAEPLTAYYELNPAQRELLDFPLTGAKVKGNSAEGFHSFGSPSAPFSTNCRVPTGLSVKSYPWLSVPMANTSSPAAVTTR